MTVNELKAENKVLKTEATSAKAQALQLQAELQAAKFEISELKGDIGRIATLVAKLVADLKLDGKISFWTIVSNVGTLKDFIVEVIRIVKDKQGV